MQRATALWPDVNATNGEGPQCFGVALELSVSVCRALGGVVRGGLPTTDAKGAWDSAYAIQ